MVEVVVVGLPLESTPVVVVVPPPVVVKGIPPLELLGGGLLLSEPEPLDADAPLPLPLPEGDDPALEPELLEAAPLAPDPEPLPEEGVARVADWLADGLVEEERVGSSVRAGSAYACVTSVVVEGAALVAELGAAAIVLLDALTVWTVGVGATAVGVGEVEVGAVVGTMLKLTDDVDGGDMTASPTAGSDPGS